MFQEGELADPAPTSDGIEEAEQVKQFLDKEHEIFKSALADLDDNDDDKLSPPAPPPSLQPNVPPEVEVRKNSQTTLFVKSLFLSFLSLQIEVS